VAGKGISAALLMAAFESICGPQLTAGIPGAWQRQRPAEAMAAGAHAFSAIGFSLGVEPAGVCHTSPEKYALYFGLYDDENRTLTYTNAGHLPPIPPCAMAQRKRLEVTGTVGGRVFRSRRTKRKASSCAGRDLLVAFNPTASLSEKSTGETLARAAGPTCCTVWAARNQKNHYAHYGDGRAVDRVMRSCSTT